MSQVLRSLLVMAVHLSLTHIPAISPNLYSCVAIVQREKHSKTTPTVPKFVVACICIKLELKLPQCFQWGQALQSTVGYLLKI